MFRVQTPIIGSINVAAHGFPSFWFGGGLESRCVGSKNLENHMLQINV